MTIDRLCIVMLYKKKEKKRWMKVKKKAAGGALAETCRGWRSYSQVANSAVAFFFSFANLPRQLYHRARSHAPAYCPTLSACARVCASSGVQMHAKLMLWRCRRGFLNQFIITAAWVQCVLISWLVVVTCYDSQTHTRTHTRRHALGWCLLVEYDVRD